MSAVSDSPKLTPPQTRQVRIEEVGGDLELSYRYRSWLLSCFLLIVFLGWSIGTFFVICGFFILPNEIELWLVPLPFIAAWFPICFLTAWALFGVERVRLGFESLEYRATILLTFYRRTIPRQELQGVCAGVTLYTVGEGRDERAVDCLLFATSGKPLRFARGINVEEQRWLVDWLNAYLGTTEPPNSFQQKSTAQLSAPKPSLREVLQPGEALIDRPLDSRIEIHQQRDTVAFTWRGRWNMMAIVETTFVHVFWNGILGVFICSLIRDFEWRLFFFLIPFEVLGLLIIANWGLALIAPAWRLTRIFSEREIAQCIGGFGIRWHKRLAIQPPVRIGLQRREREGEAGSWWTFLALVDGEAGLFFTDTANKGLPEIDEYRARETLVGWLQAVRAGKALRKIDGLTEGDARWMVGVLLRTFPSWTKHKSEPRAFSEPEA